jgi:Spy/CpxP family protein refolding chaperone
MTSPNMLMRFGAACAVALVLAFSPQVAAQGFKWWQTERFIKELGLTGEQTRRLEEIFQKALPGLKAQKSALDAAETRFAQLIESGDSAAMEQINVVETARAELNTSRALMLWNMRQVLTRDQYVKFTALHLQVEREMAQAAAQKGAAKSGTQKP